MYCKVYGQKLRQVYVNCATCCIWTFWFGMVGWVGVNVFHWESNPPVDAGYWYYFIGGIVLISVFAIACLPIVIVLAWIMMWYESAQKACGMIKEEKQ